MPKYLLNPTTAAAQSSAVIGDIHALPLHFTAPGLSGSETVTIQKQNASGTWDTYTSADQLTATKLGIAIYAPGVYRGDKSATASAVGVEISTLYNP